MLPRKIALLKTNHLVLTKHTWVGRSFIEGFKNAFAENRSGTVPLVVVLDFQDLN